MTPTKKLAKILALVALCFAAGSFAHQASACTATLGDTCMAAYTGNTNPGESIFRFISPNYYNGWCQPFTVDAGATNYYVTHAAFNLKKTGTPIATFMYRIYDNAGGANCSTQLGTLLGGNDNVNAASAGGTAALIDGPPTTNIQLVTGHTYFLIASTTAAGTGDTNYWQGTISNSAPPYSDEYYKLNESFNQETGYNMTFEIDGSATPPFAAATPPLSGWFLWFWNWW